MKVVRKISFLAILIILASFGSVYGQDQQGINDDTNPSLLEALKNQEQAMNLKVQVRQIDSSNRITWFTDLSRVTVYGRMENVKIEGGNFIIDSKFTAFKDTKKILLNVQSGIWVQDLGQKKVQYHTHMQTLSLILGEPVLYYPLGLRKPDGSGPVNVLEMEISILGYQGQNSLPRN